ASAGRRTVVMVAVALCGLALLAAQAKPGDNFPPAVAATVRVVSAADNCNGSGVIVRRSGPHVYILTAHHVVARASKVEVHVRKASASKPAVYRSAEVVARSAEVDLAVVRLASTDTFPQPLRLASPRWAPAKRAFAALSAGWASGDAPTALD